MKLTSHFTLEEMIVSETAERLGIDNSPSTEVLSNLRGLTNFLEVVREKIKKPIFVSSGYRCPELNRAIGGSRSSQHMKGLAADIVSRSYGTPAELAEVIVALDLEFDQVILEFGRWVHVSVAENPRHQILTAKHSPAGVVYEPGLVV